MSCLSGNSSILLPGTMCSSRRDRYKGDVKTSPLYLPIQLEHVEPGNNIVEWRIRAGTADECQAHGSSRTPNIRLRIALLFQISSALCCLFTGEREEPSDWLSSALPVLMGPGLTNRRLIPESTPLYSSNEWRHCRVQNKNTAIYLNLPKFVPGNLLHIKDADSYYILPILSSR